MGKQYQVRDSVLIGAGIMSATLAMFLKELEPDMNIEIIEAMKGPAEESSSALNNAGTGHAALCEVNYTPVIENGTVDISRAININTSFEESRQFWAYLTKKGLFTQPNEFINTVPHMTMCQGENDVGFLRRRYDAMHPHPCFAGMEFTSDIAHMKQWAPLLFVGDRKDGIMAMTNCSWGTDVNFGTLTTKIISHLSAYADVTIRYQQKVTRITKRKDNLWVLTVKDQQGEHEILTRFVFIGAGGGSFTLLREAEILSGRNYAGFPISGLWLKCTNDAIIHNHDTKVYSKAAVGAPPMSVPHLDTRIIDDEKHLLFGPFAGFSTKFLKHGSWLDLPLSLRGSMILPMLKVGLDNIPLIRYLIGQVMETPKNRMNELRTFYPGANEKDWSLLVAGQRVQIIKNNPRKGGTLQFGTEVVKAEDGSLAALLGASPGASTSVSIMLNLLEKCFPDKYHSPTWQKVLKKMVPYRAEMLAINSASLEKVRAQVTEILALQ